MDKNGAVVKYEDLGKLEKKIEIIEYKLRAIFDTIEEVKLDLWEEKIKKQLHEAEKQKEDAEIRIQDFKTYTMTRYDKYDEDKRVFDRYRICDMEGMNETI